MHNWSKSAYNEKSLWTTPVNVKASHLDNHVDGESPKAIIFTSEHGDSLVQHIKPIFNWVDSLVHARHTMSYK